MYIYDTWSFLLGLIVCLVGLCIYLVPSIIGHDKKHAAGIIVLNVLGGWTVVGWIGAIVWAVSDPRKETAK